MSIAIDIIFGDNPKFSHISNAGPLEQEQRRFLIVVLYESFYAG